jgi:hypothetical protein
MGEVAVEGKIHPLQLQPWWMCTMQKTMWTGWLLLVCLGSTGALAQDNDVRRCRMITDNMARLNCYDTLLLPLPSGTLARSSDAPLPGEIVPVPAVALFGMEHQSDRQVKEISSRIVGNFEGWGPRSRFRLENGQVWQISDESSGVYALKSPRVKIARAVLGGFEMEIEGANRAPRVKRLE